MPKLILLSAISAIAFGGIAAGSTYALFTSSAETKTTVTAGKVDVSATITDLTTYSGVDLTGDTSIDAAKIKKTTEFDNGVNGKFINGGTASINGNTLTLSEVTPGDKVTFNINITNSSTVATKYRTVISSDDGDLFDELEFKIGDEIGTSYSSWNMAESKTLDCYVSIPSDVSDDYQGKSCEITFKVEAVQANAKVEKHYDSLEKAFNLSSTTSTSDPLVLDGEGLVYIDKWVDYWIDSNITIKGVVFNKGASFSLKASDGLTVSFDSCTFYPCKQSELNYSGNNTTANSGDGMCFNIDKQSAKNVTYKISNCKFIGENDDSLPIYGNAYNASGEVYDAFKKRGHGIAFDAIAGGGDSTYGGSIKTALIKNCQIEGVHGNAIQLYGYTGEITIKNTKIKSWGINSGNYVKGTETKDGNATAIRGDYSLGGTKKVNLVNVYFGLDEGVHGVSGKK